MVVCECGERDGGICGLNEGSIIMGKRCGLLMNTYLEYCDLNRYVLNRFSFSLALLQLLLENHLDRYQSRP